MNEEKNPFADFKFTPGDQVRHVADSQPKYGRPDAKLLVLNRSLCEETGVQGVQKLYECRIIQPTNSFGIVRLQESELISLADFQRRELEVEAEQDENMEAFRVESKRLREERKAAQQA